MPKEKHRDLHFNMEAANEVDLQAKRADYQAVRDWLEQLAESLAAGDSGRPDDLCDVVERKHVVLSAEKLFGSDSTWLDLLDPGHGIFLSYSTKDEDFARELRADLQEEGVKGFLVPFPSRPDPLGRKRSGKQSAVAVRLCS